MAEEQKSVAHKHDMNNFGQDNYPDGLVPWSPQQSPDVTAAIRRNECQEDER